jgi:uncharacterized surface protein with fasciclin (FAS1) repeats
MRNKLVVSLLAVAFGVALVASACSKDNVDARNKLAEATTTTPGSDKATTSSTTTTTSPKDAKTVVDIARADPELSTLVDLVQTAGLDDTLTGAGPYTVFAPTNSAFAQLPSSTMDQLRADPQGALANVLRLHVLSGAEDAVQLGDLAGKCVTTLNGKVQIGKDGDTITFGGAPIVKTDITASNGVIHLIDGVVLAPSTTCS